MLKMLSGELREAGGSSPAPSKKTSAQSAQLPPSFRSSRESRLWVRSKRMVMASAGPLFGHTLFADFLDSHVGHSTYLNFEALQACLNAVIEACGRLEQEI